jgi:D-3-phosphoglycerate dehydrogenase
MAMVKILICDPIANEGIKTLRDSGFQVDEKTSITHKELVDIANNYDALIVRSRTKINKEVLDAALNLKVIARAGVGLDNIDLREAEIKGVEVLNIPEAPSNAVAELVAGFIISLARRITKADHSMKTGAWNKKELTGFEVEGKTLGILGFGRIGYALAKKMKGMGMKIIAYDVDLERVKKYMDEQNVESVTIDKLLSGSDFITLHVPLLASTKHMIGIKEFNKMKKGSYIINVSRGGVIDEEALKDALASRHLAGAALDVYELEPPNDSELINRDNVITTPHIGASTIEAQIANSTIIAEKLIKILS